ncbi:MAG: membrane protein insertase YidC [Verrucomicrobiota bacterium]
MDRTGWIAIIACVALLFGWQYIVRMIYPEAYKPESQPQTSEQIDVEKTSEQASSATAYQELQQLEGSPSLSAVTDLLMEKDIPAEKVAILQNEDFLLEFTTHGGGIKKIELKEHYVEQGGEPIILNKAGQEPLLNMKGGDLGVMYSIVGYDLKKADSSRVVFERQIKEGLKLVREYSLDPEKAFRVLLTQKFVNEGANDVIVTPHRMSLGLAEPIYGRGDENNHLNVGWMYENGDYKSEKITTFDDFNLLFIPISKGKNVLQSEAEMKLEWATLDSQFFAIITDFTESEGAYDLRASKAPLPHLRDKNEKIPGGIRATVQLRGLIVPAGQTIERKLSVFTGPKFAKLLNNAEKKHVVDAGFFGFISKPLHSLMNFIHGFVGNYGWAIVIMTLVIRLILWYPQTMANISMKKMSVVAPVMKEMQEKYKDNPQKLQQEMMSIYKDYGVNPVGGCLPMLLQMPIFIGFYWMLLGAIELRQQGFIWWMTDLSRPDTVASIPLPGLGELPLNPLPILMTVTMFLTFQMAPKQPGMDNNPAYMMMKFMPIIVGVICYNFASGLSLYWTVSNILSIAQTYFNNKIPMPTAEELKAKADAKKSFRKEVMDKSPATGGGLGRPLKKIDKGSRSTKSRKKK